MPDSTSTGLLRQLREPHCDAAWKRFVDLYAPLIFHWGKAHSLSAADAADLVQEVMVVLLAKLPHFEYDRQLRFRGWLRTITVNKANNIHRRNSRRPSQWSGETIEHVAEPNGQDLFDKEQYQRYLVGRMRQLMEVEFEPTTWQACWETTTEGRSAAEVGRELGITAGAVRVAKCRVLRRLREELGELIDQSDEVM